MTTLSRVLGYVRDAVIVVFVSRFGTDAFLVAFKIPNFLRRLFAEGAFSQAFVPVLVEQKTQGSAEDVRDLAAHVSGTLAGILFLVSLLGVLGAPLLIAVFAPGFLDQPAKYDLAVQMLRITFPYLLFVSLTAFAGGILNAYGRFAVPAITPVFLNLAIIGSAVLLGTRMPEPAVALAWGVFIGGVVQLLFQLPFLLRLKVLGRPRFGPRHPGVKKILRLMLPAIFGVSVSQINLLIDTLIASFLVTGSVTWLFLSDRIVEFPLGVFGIAVATVLLPSLSERHASGNGRSFSASLDWGLRWVLLIGAPSAVGIALLAGPILSTLFQYREFRAWEVDMAQLSVWAYSLGLLGFMFIKVLAPAYFSRQDTRTPVRIGVIAMLCNVVMNLMLVFSLAHAGLALATSLSALINAGLLYGGLRRQGIYAPAGDWPVFLLRVLVACLIMAGVLWFGSGELLQWKQWGAWDRAWHLLMWVTVGAGVYFLVLLTVGLRPRQFLRPAGA